MNYPIEIALALEGLVDDLYADGSSIDGSDVMKVARTAVAIGHAAGLEAAAAMCERNAGSLTGRRMTATFLAEEIRALGKAP